MSDTLAERCIEAMALHDRCSSATLSCSLHPKLASDTKMCSHVPNYIGSEADAAAAAALKEKLQASSFEISAEQKDLPHRDTKLSNLKMSELMKRAVRCSTFFARCCFG